MKKVFTVEEVKGSKRTSENANYTHALVGEYDHDRTISFYQNVKSVEWRGRDYDYYKEIANATTNDIQFKNPFGGAHTYYKAEEIEEKKQFIAENPDKNKWLEKVREGCEEQAKKAKEKSKGVMVLAWSSRADLAEKRKAEFTPTYKNLKVLPVTRIK